MKTFRSQESTHATMRNRGGAQICDLWMHGKHVTDLKRRFPNTKLPNLRLELLVLPWWFNAPKHSDRTIAPKKTGRLVGPLVGNVLFPLPKNWLRLFCQFNAEIARRVSPCDWIPNCCLLMEDLVDLHTSHQGRGTIAIPNPRQGQFLRWNLLLMDKILQYLGWLKP